MKTVADLIAELQKYPSHLYVVQSKDSEGNGFAPFGDISYGTWEPENPSRPYYGEFTGWHYDRDEWGDRDESTERALTLDESNAICLWP
jgi:hypothetical protein